MPFISPVTRLRSLSVFQQSRELWWHRSWHHFKRTALITSTKTHNVACLLMTACRVCFQFATDFHLFNITLSDVQIDTAFFFLFFLVSLYFYHVSETLILLDSDLAAHNQHRSINNLNLRFWALSWTQTQETTLCMVKLKRGISLFVSNEL